MRLARTDDERRLIFVSIITITHGRFTPYARGFLSSQNTLENNPHLGSRVGAAVDLAPVGVVARGGEVGVLRWHPHCKSVQFSHACKLVGPKTLARACASQSGNAGECKSRGNHPQTHAATHNTHMHTKAPWGCCPRGQPRSAPRPRSRWSCRQQRGR